MIRHSKILQVVLCFNIIILDKKVPLLENTVIRTLKKTYTSIVAALALLCSAVRKHPSMLTVQSLDVNAGATGLIFITLAKSFFRAV